MKRFVVLLLLVSPGVGARQKADKPAEPKPEARPEGKPEARPEPKGEAKGDAKGEPKGDAKGEEPAPASVPAAAAGDLDALRKEYEAIRESLFTSRARAAAVGDAVYSAKIQVQLRYAAGRFHSIRRATIRLDGANVYDDTTSAVTTDEAPRFEGFVAPGTHLVTIRLEAQAKDDDRFVTTTEDTFTVDAVAGRVLVVRGRADDGGDMAFAWKKKQKGSYKLRLDVQVETRERGR